MGRSLKDLKPCMLLRCIHIGECTFYHRASEYASFTPEGEWVRGIHTEYTGWHCRSYQEGIKRKHMKMRNDIGMLWKTYGWSWWCEVFQGWRLCGIVREIFPSCVVTLMKGMLCGETLNEEHRAILTKHGIDPDSGKRDAMKVELGKGTPNGGK